MNKKFTNNQLMGMYKTMLDAQKQGGDFDLTIRDLCVIWGHPTSTSAARYHLPKLVEMGLVKYKESGKNRKVYRAIETSQNQTL